jgi:thiamine biosynthesis protein ThiS
MKNIIVNGKDHPYKDGMTVASLLAEVLTTPGTVVVEVNGEIIQRERFDEMPLNTGDMIEIVNFVGGG